MKYAKNYLKQVIFRLDFDPILSLSGQAPADFQNRIQAAWPRSRQGEEIELGTIISPDAKMNTVNRRKRWTFSTDDEAKAVTLSDSSLFIEYKTYENIKVAQADFEFLWKEFLGCYEVRSLNRIGLRYIDEIVLPTGSPTDWAGYLGQWIVTAVLNAPSPPDHRLTRSLSSVSWLADDHRVNFTFGMYNSDFPNPVAKREFVLDFDCFSVDPVPAANAVECLLSYNAVIHRLFESSIGDRLREEMGIVEDDRQPEEKRR